jgi:hypothetical protein
MRNFGLFLLAAGIAGFVYCSHEVKDYEPVPEGVSLSRSLDYMSGRMEVGRYAGMGAAALGILLFMMPQGRA